MYLPGFSCKVLAISRSIELAISEGNHMPIKISSTHSYFCSWYLFYKIFNLVNYLQGFQ